MVERPLPGSTAEGADRSNMPDTGWPVVVKPEPKSACVRLVVGDTLRRSTLASKYWVLSLSKAARTSDDRAQVTRDAPHPRDLIPANL
jgi:hypothetical protein